MSHEGYHEPIEKLSSATQDFHRAVVSLIEELEASTGTTSAWTPAAIPS